MFKQPNSNQSFPALEEAILNYWEKNHTFKRSLEIRAKSPEYVFYDGPPFATGLPHYGHILAGTLKDVVPRYATMRGYLVNRKWGWDCHGLPVENLIEQDLGLADKQALEKFGVDNFNEACRSSVLKYVDNWRSSVNRMGRWVDFDDDYKTMDASYMESVWWAFKKLWDKKLIYQGKKPMHICPRCVTPLSNFEVGQGYKDVTDFSITSKFKLKETAQKKKLFGKAPTYVLAWTTTPWTLPGNSGLAVGKDITYTVEPHNDGSFVILAMDCFSSYAQNFESEKPKGKTIKGKYLINLTYEPLFANFTKTKDPNTKTSWRIIATDFVSTESGSGVVHIAPGYGEDDMNAGKEHHLLNITHVNMDGSFVKEMGPKWKSLSVSGENKKRKTDEFIWAQLEKKDYAFERKPYKHSYPHCWRCDTPLLNYGTDAWYVDINKVKKKMISNNQKINWVPSHLKDGRFGKWLEGARDWAISRNRYWGSPLPVWQSEDGSEVECIGSMRELRAKLNQQDTSSPPFKGETGQSALADDQRGCVRSPQHPPRITKITLIRHGESEGNAAEVYQGQTPGSPLTKHGQHQAKECAKLMSKIHKEEPFDLIFTSPLLRAQQTAEIIHKKLSSTEGDDSNRRLPEIVVEPAITETKFGKKEGLSRVEDHKDRDRRESLPAEEHYLDVIGKTGESHLQIEKRMVTHVRKLLKKNAGKSIAIVSHSDPLRWLLRGLNNDPYAKVYAQGHLPYATPKELYFDNETGELLDLHKHFVDEMTWKSPSGQTMKRIPEVLDCWFESGSMPYAQMHYPFENKERFEKTFPGQFIAEGLDQTRGWFYTLVVLASALFDKPAFQNVIVNGIVLAEDGQKMSKRKQNYPPPGRIFNEYGADAMRIYLMNSPVVHADDLRFSEHGVNEVLRSTLLPLWNAYSFFLTYANIDGWRPKGQLYFIRHGETDLNRDYKMQGPENNPSLNEAGILQIEKAKKLVDNLGIDIIVSSDLERARESAVLLNEGRNLELIIDSAFREQDFGEFEGRSIDELLEKNTKGLHNYYYLRTAHKKGEKLEAYEERIMKATKKYQKKYPNKNILVVSHSGSLHMVKKNHIDQTWKEYFLNQSPWFRNADIQKYTPPISKRSNKLDAWIISELNTLTKNMTQSMEVYDLQQAIGPLVTFIESLTNWYIRRSRRRFWRSENDRDKAQAYETLHRVLIELAKLLAPFAPFIAEEIFRNLTGEESVHLQSWPVVHAAHINTKLNAEIKLAQQIVSLGHAARAKAYIKVRQPLAEIQIALPPSPPDKGETDQSALADDQRGSGGALKDQTAVIAEELNVKKVTFLKKLPSSVQMVVKPNARVLGPKYGGEVQKIIKAARNGQFTHKGKKVKILKYLLEEDEFEVAYTSVDKDPNYDLPIANYQVEASGGLVVILDTAVTEPLRLEGIARDLIRTIQDLRKEADFNVTDRITVGIMSDDLEVKKALKKFEKHIAKETLAGSVVNKNVDSTHEKVCKVDDNAVTITIKKSSE